LAEESRVLVLDTPGKETLQTQIEQADIVHLEWWNHAAVYDFLRTSWPAMRLLVFCHIAGDVSPNLITSKVVDFADFWVSGCGYAQRHAVIQALPPDIQSEKTAVVTAAADLSRLSNLHPKAHHTFNVAYIGSCDFKKMHPQFISMSARVQAPDIRFIVCGDGHFDLLKRQAEELGAAARFDFRGYVEDIRSILEVADVYGYPLCLNPGAELNLQEAMYAGVPPVVFPRGGIVDAVRHQETGLIVRTEDEYVKAIEFLYENPEHRRRMSQAARQFAAEHFGGERSAAKLHRVYQRLLRCPKRQHTWTASAHRSPTAPNCSGAEFFLESLGCSQTPYHVSLYSPDTQAVFAADEEIAKQSPLERMLLGTYREFYPDDVRLPYWLGLAWQSEGQHGQAAAEFSMARLDGPIAWRLDWRRAEAAARLGDFNRAAELCQDVLRQVPGFTPARRLVNQHA
jgi:hypothetical protein